MVRGDLADRAAVDAAFDHGPGGVVHLAAQAGVRYSLTNPHAYVDTNVTGTLNVLEACRHRGTEHLVFASSSSVYGANTAMPFSVHDNVDHPVSLYAATKKANELMAHTYSHLYRIPTTGLRFFTVYGPWGRPDMAAFLFTKAILEGRPIDVFNQGNMRRDFTYIDDIVEGVVRVLDRVPAARSGLDRRRPRPGQQRRPLPAVQHRQQQPGGADGPHRRHREGPRPAGRAQPPAHAAGRRPRHLRRRRRPGPRRRLLPGHARSTSGSPASSPGTGITTRV